MLFMDPISGDDARQLAEHELAKAKYHEGESLLHRLLQWILSKFDGFVNYFTDGSGPNWTRILLVALLIAVVAVVVWRLRQVRIETSIRTPRPQAAFLAGVTASPEELMTHAERCVHAGSFADAVVFAYRAVFVSASSRQIITMVPSTTPLAAGVALSEALTTDAFSGALLFNEVLYSDHVPSAEQATWALEDARSLCARIEAHSASPTPVGVAS